MLNIVFYNGGLMNQRFREQISSKVAMHASILPELTSDSPP
jgi:hypothetical protein